MTRDRSHYLIDELEALGNCLCKFLCFRESIKAVPDAWSCNVTLTDDFDAWNMLCLKPWVLV